jgi:hypothetical protein
MDLGLEAELRLQGENFAGKSLGQEGSAEHTVMVLWRHRSMYRPQTSF